MSDTLREADEAPSQEQQNDRETEVNEVHEAPSLFLFPDRTGSEPGGGAERHGVLALPIGDELLRGVLGDRAAEVDR